MGVSLERVQFKFASIVGELCNEPDVLSQFAVWLDLRLAEYKLKGNISLDCSGEEPDPIWLKGLNKGKTNKSRKTSHTGVPGSSPSHSRNSSSHHYSSHYVSAEQDSSQHYSSDHYTSQDISHSVLERTSPEVVLVKEESEEVFPVSLHYNDPQSGESRKRQIKGTPLYGNNQSTPTKQRRFSQPSESPSNQSLMSVISGYQGNTQESDSKGDNSSFVLPSTSSMAATDSFNIGSGTETSFSSSQNTFTESGWQNQQDTSSENGNDGKGPASETKEDSKLMSSTEKLNLKRDESIHRKMRISRERLDQMSAQTIISTVAAVGVFERWLWNTYSAERRSLYDIPPAELNMYFVEFFGKITMPNGQDYKRGSFINLMSNLARYMEASQYPVSLKGSREFRDAVGIYTLRRQHLAP